MESENSQNSKNSQNDQTIGLLQSIQSMMSQQLSTFESKIGQNIKDSNLKLENTIRQEFNELKAKVDIIETKQNQFEVDLRRIENNPTDYDSDNSEHGTLSTTPRMGRGEYAIVNNQPDLVFFYCQPLVDQVPFKNEFYPYGSDILDTDTEYLSIYSNIKQTNKAFNIAKEAINYKDLLKIISKKPRIIHIGCHGDQDKASGQYFLQFENVDDGKDGVSHTINEDMMQNILSNIQKFEIQMVFIAACHSKRIGQIFLDAGVPIVISVNQHSMIADDICIEFSKHFYQLLLDGQNVQGAFESARLIVGNSNKKCKSCCCAHKHTRDCQWQKYAQIYGYDKAHEIHAGQCNCNLPKNQHKGGRCDILKKFFRILRDFEDSENAKEDLEGRQSNGLQQAYIQKPLNEKYILKEDKIYNICCCGEDDMYHDESMKFDLKTSGPEGEDYYMNSVLFENSLPGEVAELYPKIQLDEVAQCDERFLIGRNVVIQKCLSMLNDRSPDKSRLIILTGNPDECKKEIGKYAVKYSLKRGNFQNGAYEIEIAKGYKTNDFLNQLYRRMELSTENSTVDQFIKLVNGKQMVVVIVYCDEIIKNDRAQFEQLIDKLLTKTYFLKIIMINDDSNYIMSKKLYQEIVKVEVVKLQYAAKILKAFDYKDLYLKYKQEDQLRKHKIFENNPTSYQIFEIYQLFKNDKNLDHIESHQFHKIIYKQIVKLYKEEVNFLFLLSQHPKGLTLSQLSAVIKEYPIFMGSWKEFLSNSLYDKTIVIEETEEDDAPSPMSSQEPDSTKPGFKVVQCMMNYESQQRVFYLKEQMIKYINHEVLQTDVHIHLYQYLKYYAKSGRELVHSLKRQDQCDFDIHLLSAEISQGLFAPAPSTLKESEQLENVRSRLNQYELNIIQAFEHKLLSKLFEQECVNNYPEAIKALEEIYVTYTTLQLMTNRGKEDRLKDLIAKFAKFETIFGQFKSHFETKDDQFKVNQIQNALGKLILMKIGLLIKNKTYQDVKQNIIECTRLFAYTNNTQGYAETLFMNAVWQLTNYRNKQASLTDPQNYYKEDIQLKLKNEISDYYGYVVDDLQKAQDQFQELNEELNQARVVLLRANLFSSNPEHSQQEQNLTELIQAEEQFKSNGYMQHSVECMKYIGQIHFDKQEYQKADLALTKAIIQSKDAAYFQIQELIDLSRKIKSKIQTHAFNSIIMMNSNPMSPGVQDMSGQSNGNRLRDNEVRINASGLEMMNSLNKQDINMNVTFQVLNIKQLQKIKENGCSILSLDSEILDNDGKLCIEGESGRLQKLSAQDLKYLLKSEDNSKLKIDVVIVNMQNGSEIAKVFKDLGVKQVFAFDEQKLQSERDEYSSEYDDSEDEFQYSGGENELNMSEYWIESISVEQYKSSMRRFTVEMIRNLSKQQGIQEAYEQAMGSLKGLFVADQRYILKGIRWVKGRKQPNFKIEKTEQQWVTSIQLAEEPFLYEYSDNELTNVCTSFSPLVGRNSEIKSILKFLHDRNTKTTYLTGPKGQGKTRLAHEMANFVSQRNIFEHGVFYLDLKSIKKQVDIENMLRKYGLYNNLFYTGKQSPKNMKNMLLIYDHIDHIVDDDMVFKRHVKMLKKLNPKLKFLVIKSKASKNLMPNEKEIRLTQLSKSQSVKLLKLYSLKQVQAGEEEKIQSTSVDQGLKLYDQILEEGCPANLMKLAGIMREKDSNVVTVEALNEYQELVNRVHIKHERVGGISFQQELRIFEAKMNTENFQIKMGGGAWSDQQISSKQQQQVVDQISSAAAGDNLNQEYELKMLEQLYLQEVEPSQHLMGNYNNFNNYQNTVTQFEQSYLQKFLQASNERKYFIKQFVNNKLFNLLGLLIQRVQKLESEKQYLMSENYQRQRGMITMAGSGRRNMYQQAQVQMAESSTEPQMVTMKAGMPVINTEKGEKPVKFASSNGVQFQIHIDEATTIKGEDQFIMTNKRLIFLHTADKDKNKVKHYEIQMCDIQEEKYQQPIFGSNFIEGAIRQRKGESGNNAGIKFKMWFTKGGAPKFVENWRKALKKAREVSISGGPGGPAKGEGDDSADEKDKRSLQDYVPGNYDAEGLTYDDKLEFNKLVNYMELHNDIEVTNSNMTNLLNCFKEAKEMRTSDHQRVDLNAVLRLYQSRMGSSQMEFLSKNYIQSYQEQTEAVSYAKDYSKRAAIRLDDPGVQQSQPRFARANEQQEEMKSMQKPLFGQENEEQNPESKQMMLDSKGSWMWQNVPGQPLSDQQVINEFYYNQSSNSKFQHYQQYLRINSFPFFNKVSPLLRRMPQQLHGGAAQERPQTMRVSEPE